MSPLEKLPRSGDGGAPEPLSLTADIVDTGTTPTTPVSSLIATCSMCYYCFDVLIQSLKEGQRSMEEKRKQSMPHFVSDLTDATVECPIFVTWDQCNNGSHHWQLRGCIGTLAPRLLLDAVGEYAFISALKDRRFRPITLAEIPSLRVSVSLLVQYETCSDAYDWTVGVHGIMIQFVVDEDIGSSSSQSSYSATYLPEVAKEQQWTVPHTVASLVQKAGYHGTVTPELFKSIQCTRYQSSKCGVTFDEYIQEHCHGTNPFTVLDADAAALPQINSSTTADAVGQSCQQM